jgi:glycosyltransferase involved in cell wall biosynthesis
MVPLLDDVHGIGPCLDAILGQHDRTSRIVEVLVADGGSTDGSRQEIALRSTNDDRVALVENPERYVPTGLNLCIAAARGEVIVRVDSHTVIAADYVDTAVALLDESGAAVVGGPMRPIGREPFGEAVAWALCSRWGIGGSRFHDVAFEGPSDSTYMGVFPRATFERFGVYDTAFVRNQDDELTYRIRAHGGVVWVSTRLHSSYQPRGSAAALFRQFRGYGHYKPLVLRRHGSAVRARHLAPPLVALGWLLLPVSVWLPLLCVPAALHLAVTAAVAGTSGDNRSRRWVALLAMHLGYGVGFIAGVPSALRDRGPQRDASARAAPPPATPRGEAS